MFVLSSVLPSNQLYRRLLLALGVATAALAGYFFIAGRPRHKKLGAVVKSGDPIFTLIAAERHFRP